MNNILIVGDEEKLSYRSWPGTRTTSWQNFAAHGFDLHAAEHAVDIVILHLEARGAIPLPEAVRLREKQPDLGFVYVVDINDKVLPKRSRAALSEPGITWVSSTASAEELELRLQGLKSEVNRSRKRVTSTRSKLSAKTAVAPASGVQLSWDHVMPELHNPESGRLDAVCMAEWFGISVKKFAGLLDRAYATVHKTPDAASLQGRLVVFLRIASALSRLAGSRDGARIWLNTPNPDLEEKQTPFAVIELGEAEIIAELLEDALVGQPG